MHISRNEAEWAITPENSGEPVAAALFTFLPVYALTQTVTGTLSGRINGPSGAVLSKVNVKAIDRSTGGVREATTNNNGYFQLNFVPICADWYLRFDDERGLGPWPGRSGLLAAREEQIFDPASLVPFAHRSF